MKKKVLPFILAVVVLAGGVIQLFCWASHRTQAYTGQLLIQEIDGNMCGLYTDYVVITDIYKDCFFARSLRTEGRTYRFKAPLPYHHSKNDLLWVEYYNEKQDRNGKLEADVFQIRIFNFEMMAKEIEYKLRSVFP